MATQELALANGKTNPFVESPDDDSPLSKPDPIPEQVAAGLAAETGVEHEPASAVGGDPTSVKVSPGSREVVDSVLSRLREHGIGVELTPEGEVRLGEGAPGAKLKTRVPTYEFSTDAPFAEMLLNYIPLLAEYRHFVVSEDRLEVFFDSRAIGLGFEALITARELGLLGANGSNVLVNPEDRTALISTAAARNLFVVSAQRAGINTPPPKPAEDLFSLIAAAGLTVATMSDILSDYVKAHPEADRIATGDISPVAEQMFDASKLAVRHYLSQFGADVVEGENGVKDSSSGEENNYGL